MHDADYDALYVFLYDDAMRVPACRTSHQLVVRADHMIRRSTMYIICTLCAKNGPNYVS